MGGRATLYDEIPLKLFFAPTGRELIFHCPRTLLHVNGGGDKRTGEGEKRQRPIFRFTFPRDRAHVIPAHYRLMYKKNANSNIERGTRTALAHALNQVRDSPSSTSFGLKPDPGCQWFG